MFSKIHFCALAAFCSLLAFAPFSSATAGQLFPPSGLTDPRSDCPSGKVLSWKGNNGDGVVECSDPTPGVTVACQAGQVLTGISNGTPVCQMAGGPVLLNTLVANNSSNLTDTTSFTLGYRHYLIEIDDLVPASGGASLFADVEADGVFQSAQYQSSDMIFDAHGIVGGGFGVASALYLGGNGRLDQTAGLNGEIYMNEPGNGSLYKMFHGQIAHHDTVYRYPSLVDVVTTYAGSTAPITGIEFFMSNGPIASGTIQIYGWN